jgi:hypothetical protein
MIPALRSVSLVRRLGPVGGGAYSGLLGSLPGTSSAVPSSWALQKISVSHLRFLCRRSTKRGKKKPARE